MSTSFFGLISSAVTVLLLILLATLRRNSDDLEKVRLYLR